MHNIAIWYESPAINALLWLSRGCTWFTSRIILRFSVRPDCIIQWTNWQKHIAFVLHYILGKLQWMLLKRKIYLFFYASTSCRYTVTSAVTSSWLNCLCIFTMIFLQWLSSPRSRETPNTVENNSCFISLETCERPFIWPISNLSAEPNHSGLLLHFTQTHFTAFIASYNYYCHAAIES